MSSDFKSIGALPRVSDDPELPSSNGDELLTEKGIGVYKILNGLRKLGHRMPSGNQADPYDSNIIPGGDDRRIHDLGRKYGPLLSGTAYCISSCSMILLNKIVLSSYNFNAGISLMFYQNLIAATVVLLLGFSGVVSLERFTWKLIKVWSPVNVIFVGMLSLKYINIAMGTILKNVTNILTAIGELYVFRKHQNQKV